MLVSYSQQYITEFMINVNHAGELGIPQEQNSLGNTLVIVTVHLQTEIARSKIGKKLHFAPLPVVHA